MNRQKSVMDDTKKTIISGIKEFFLLTILTLAAPLIIATDVLIIGHKGIPETSVTELMQELLLLISAVLFGLCALRIPDSRGFLVLVSGFFACLFIRELDAYFDKIDHGFWRWPALSIAAAAITFALFCRKTVARPMADFIGTKPYYHVLFGLIILLVLSRSMGSGTLLWKPIMGDAYDGAFKATLQEGLELFGYILIGYGSFLFYRQSNHTESNEEPAAN